MTDKCHTNCVGKQACLQLVKDGKNEVLNELVKRIEFNYPDEINKSELFSEITNLRK